MGVISKLVVSKKQQELDKQADATQQKLAVDFWGLSAINYMLGPGKASKQLQEFDKGLVMQFFTDLPQSEMETYLGSFRPVYRLFSDQTELAFLEDLREKKRQVMVGSFLERLLPPLAASNTYSNPETPITNSSAKEWEGLPKVVWIYWGTGLKGAYLTHLLAMELFQRYAVEEGYRLNFVSEDTISQHLDKDVLEQIGANMRGMKKVSPTTASDMYRLALLIKHGGIYFDMASLLAEDVGWVRRIAQFPSQLVHNRYGPNPKVLLTTHPLLGSPGKWEVDRDANTKYYWHMGYESSFIAAEPNSELLREWLSMFMYLHTLSFEDIQKFFKTCDLGSHAWTSNGNLYLLIMDTIKCVLGRKEKQLQQEGSLKRGGATEYFGLWTIVGLVGPQKFRSYSNFEEPARNLQAYLTDYSMEYSR